MKTKIVLLILNYIFLIELSEALFTGFRPPRFPNTQPSLKPPPPLAPTPKAPEITPPQTFDQRTPKCYPETATAYFLPAPPTPPIVTVLDPSSKDIVSNLKSGFKETSSSSSSPLTDSPQNRPSFEPPPVSVLPDLIDEVPSLIQNRVSRLAKSDVKVCDTCACMIDKLPIFNFDKELLDGFLAGLGI